MPTRYLLISAALLIQTAGAADLQQQMREVLTGTNVMHTVQRPEQDHETTVSASLDTAEYTRSVLLGVVTAPDHSVGAVNGSRTAARSAAAAHEVSSPVRPDTQASVQSFLLGKHSSVAHGT